MAETARTTQRWGRVPAWWLLHPEMDADRFCVLAALATYADEAGICSPSQATLARHLRRSRPWVNRVVAELAAAGLLEKAARSRGNGGTTSCLYRLRLSPDGIAPLPRSAAESGPVPDSDTPRHRPDTSQVNLQQDNPPAPPGSPTDDIRDTEVPADWQPSDEEAAAARGLCPDADLAAHTVRFRSKCRARGYRYRADRIGDAWLAWLLEDTAPASAPSRAGRGRVASGGHERRHAPSAAARFSAWAAAAEAPVQAWEAAA